ncbi:MAG: SpoIIE family protein phosphatase [Deltaproteobacteria bacterium]|nr:SpoIIE family protein phosphatase [Deltaproteobacteria bacterium]
MAKRSGPSISVKMILTTTLLIVLTVVGVVVVNYFKTNRDYDAVAKNQIAQRRAELEQSGAVAAQMFARAVEPQLTSNQDEEITNLVKNVVGQDTRDDKKPTGEAVRLYGLRYAYVLDRNKNVIVTCTEAKDVDCKNADHQPVAEAMGKLVANAWKQSNEAWKGKDAKALVSYELTEGSDTNLFFTFPVFTGETPTAATAMAEAAGDHRQGYVILGYDLTVPIALEKARAELQASEAVNSSAIWLGAVGAMFVLIGTLLAIFQGLQISKPIKLLAWKADQIARGDLDARVEVKSTDEIGILGENFNFMADQLVVLLQQTAEKAKMEQELEVARTIQETLVPPNEPVTSGFFKFAGYFQPASQCGGDWWTWHEQVGDKILIVIGDVTGHGVPSAMITAAAKAACDVARSVYQDDVAVTRLLEIMNYAIFESAKRKFVMTCFASIVDTKKRTITYANAGHNFPYLFRAGEDGKGEFGSLMIRGNRLGDLKESKYEAKTTELAAGDILVWYTDGIVECENAAGEEYGEKRFRASVRRAAALDAGEMRDAVVADSQVFFGETLRKDDITLVVGRIH